MCGTQNALNGVACAFADHKRSAIKSRAADLQRRVVFAEVRLVAAAAMRAARRPA